MAGADDSATSPSLLERLKDPRDKDAWEQFVKRYLPLIYGWCQRQGLQRADVEDLSQDVLERLLTVMSKFTYDPERGRFRGWLRTVTKNAVIGAYRERARLQEVLRDAPAKAGEDLAQHLDHLFTEEVVQLAEQRVRGRVEGDTWRAYEMLAKEGLTGQEVAQRLGKKNRYAVYEARNRVQKYLREEIQQIEEGPTPPEDQS